MNAEAPVVRQHGNAYNIFILVLTILSLVIMGLLILPLDKDTLDLLRLYDNIICFIFLGDFVMNLASARPKRAYFIGERGWIDLLGSIPSLGFIPAAGLLRLFRLFRLARIARLLRGNNRKQLVDDVLKNRGQYATFITILSAGMVLTSASILVLQFESRSPEANITTGGNALWWAVVTITTVGYGDFFPVTFLGRLTGFFVMVAGVGIIGALASILASILVPPAKAPEPAEVAAAGAEAVPAAALPAVAGAESAAGTAAAAPAPEPAPATTASAVGSDAVAEELALLREEIAALRAALPREPA